MSDQKIIIDTRLSIQWHCREQHLKAEQTDFNNTPVIQLLEVLESQQNLNSVKLISNKEIYGNQSDLSRLESKIDLLIQLFTRNQFNQQYSNIQSFDVSLSADTIFIKTIETLKENQLIELEIIFNQQCPEALVFSGKIIKSEFPDTLAIHFCEIGQKSQDYLEKYVFRLHRNEIARIKHT